MGIGYLPVPITSPDSHPPYLYLRSTSWQDIPWLSPLQHFKQCFRNLILRRIQALTVGYQVLCHSTRDKIEYPRSIGEWEKLHIFRT